jgi:UDP-2-acetamido-3-amino-2,3-dideoxy-glucuronate N-acetyltransferase
MPKPKIGRDVVVGRNVQFGRDVTVWNYVVIGENTCIGDETCLGSFCDVGKDVTIGKRCNIQAHVTISNGCRIGNRVFIAPNSSILNDKYPKSNFLTPSTIKDDVVIGGCVTILPDVTVESNSIIGAGSVVTKDVRAETVVMGVPARLMMSVREYKARQNEFTRAKQKV